MNKVFSDEAWDDYQCWVDHDRKILRKINELLRDIEWNAYAGTGKPEPLRHDLEGYWSRRITQEHRLIYRIESDEILIAKCRRHYR